MTIDVTTSDERLFLKDTTLRINAALIVGLAFAVSLALCWPRILDVWTTGNFYDSDDAMRLVEVRDFLRGQAWYDLTQWRLDPPQGSLMHWSRVVDTPLALLVALFQILTSATTAERLARIVFPVGLQIVLLALTAWVARILLGARGVAPAIALMVLSGFMLGQFVPGRIDHHAPQIVLLITMIGSMTAAIAPGRERLAAVAAGAIALSLAISVENLLFILVVCATPPLIWLVRGREARPLLLWFAGGLLATVPICLIAFNPPSRWFVPACDAFSIVYGLIVLAAAACCAALAAAQRFDSTFQSRLATAAVVGIAFGAPVAAYSAHCLVDPFSGLDPLVRDIWLNNVGEAQPALRHFAMYPRDVQTILFPVIAGVAGLIAAIAASRGIERQRFAFVLAQALAGCLATMFMIRVATFLVPVAMFGAAWLAVRIADVVAQKSLSNAIRSVIAIVAAVPMSSIGWAMAPTMVRDSSGAATPASGACLAARSFAPLAQLSPGLVLASIEEGAFILVHTPHSVITASYHRNNSGNRIAIDAFRAPPESAQAIVRASGATYVFVCDGAKELSLIAARWPDSLAARLLAGETIDWLAPIATEASPYRVYRVN